MTTDLRYAFRQLTRSPSFSATAVFALALGIGATTAMFAVLYAFLLRPLPYADPASLVMIQSRSRTSGNDLGVNYLDFLDWKKQNQSFSDLAFFNLRWNGNLESPDGTTETLKTTFTTANLFDLLGVEPILGRNVTKADDEPNAPKVVLISHRLWMKMFGGKENTVGRQIRLDGGLRTVVGVMPKGFRFPSQTDLWVPMASVFGMSDNRSWRADQAIGRLKAGITATEAQAEMTLIAERLSQQHKDTNNEVGAAVVPLRDYWTGGVQVSLILLLTGCGSLLLIACANVSQLLIARATVREREIAVRAALGASRWRLARQVLTETMLLALTGSAAGVILAYWLVDFAATSIPIEMPFWIQIDLNPTVLAFAIAVAFVTALIAGLLPAWHTTRTSLAPALKVAGTSIEGSATSTRLRQVVTAAQVAVSIVLLVGAGLVLRSMLKLGEVNPGFDPQHVLMMEVNPTYNGDEPAKTRVDRFDRLLHRLSQLPGIESVSANNSPPFVPQRPWNRAQLIVEGQSTDAQTPNLSANFQTVSPDYFRTLRIPLSRGRVFNERDTLEAPRVCIVSERLAKSFWPGEDAIGKHLKTGRPNATPDEDWLTVVGVVGDVRHQSLEREAGPDLYRCSLQLAWKQMHFLVRTQPGWGGDVLALGPTLRKEIAVTAPEVGAFNFVSLDREVGNSLWQQRLRGWLLGFFSIVALTLVAAGLYGMVAYGVAQRRREIGIRMALGATHGSVLRLMVGQGMKAVTFGLAFGIAGALAVSRTLQATLFGVDGNDLVTYGAACVLLMLTASVAGLIPARRASLVSPMEALRTE